MLLSFHLSIFTRPHWLQSLNRYLVSVHKTLYVTEHVNTLFKLKGDFILERITIKAKIVTLVKSTRMTITFSSSFFIELGWNVCHGQSHAIPCYFANMRSFKRSVINCSLISPEKKKYQLKVHPYRSLISKFRQICLSLVVSIEKQWGSFHVSHICQIFFKCHRT